MTRRRLAGLLAIAATLASPAALAQREAKIPRVAFLGLDSTMQAANFAGFLEGMKAQGYEDGRNVVIDHRWAEGRFDRLPDLAAELVARKPDVIVAAAPPAVRAVQKATTTIPTVVLVHDPVGSGFAETLARPGRNITGVAFQDSELSTKRLDVLRQLVPGITKVAVIWNREGGGMNSVLALEEIAKSMGIQVRPIEIQQPADLAAAVASAKAWGAGGIVQQPSPIITKNRALLLDAVARAKLPMMCEMRMYVVDGCLATYSANLPAMFRTLAEFVNRILRGANPGTLPIEQPREFELVINQRTATSLGLKISSTLQVQATEVIR